MTISDELGLGDRETSAVKRFHEQTKGKSRAETRYLEQQLLKAQPIKKYLGRKAKKSDLDRRTLKVVFATEEDINRLGESGLMKINYYLGYNSYDVDLLLSIAALFEKGAFKYDQKTNTLHVGELLFTCGNGHRKARTGRRISHLGSTKQRTGTRKRRLLHQPKNIE